MGRCEVPLTLRAILLILIAVALSGQNTRANSPDIRLIEQTLAAVLRWEILWDDSPKGFRFPNDGTIALAVNRDADFIAYCSHQAGVCVKYRTDPSRNWEGVSSASCEDKGNDEDALLAFLGKPKRASSYRDGQVSVGQGGLSGLSLTGSGITWTAHLKLGSRAEILSQYKRMHPVDAAGLAEWLRAAPSLGSRSITIACYAPTDPMVYYYVNHSGGAGEVMAAFWNRERQEWLVASSLDKIQGSERFDEMRRIIDSISCSTINFN